MAERGDSYTVSLKPSHLAWGTYRYTDTRDTIPGEGYIPIPSDVARNLNLKNQNGTGGIDILGVNIFNCVSVDGRFRGQLKAQGNHYAGDIYAKQFSGNDDLKALGDWYRILGANVGDEVSVTWISDTDIEIELIKNS